MTTRKSNAPGRQIAKEKPSSKTGKTSTKTRKGDSRNKPTDRPDKPVEEKKKVGLQLNWSRAIYIDAMIDDALVKKLTPAILKLKQESTDPVTIGIDSPGGSISAMHALLGLLQAPDQDGKTTPLYTVSTNRAYSAAASLLAFGDYSVAYPHSTILYHDVRYPGIEDVTSSKALRTARELERGNVAFALRLANQLHRRLMWVYLDLHSRFSKTRGRYSSFAEEQDAAFADVLPTGKDRAIDIVGFALTLFDNLSNPIGHEITIQALHLLNSWMQIDRIERSSIRQEDKGIAPALINAINDLVTEIRRMDSEGHESASSPDPDDQHALSESAQQDITLLFEVIARRFANDKSLSISGDALDSIMEEFAFMKDMNSGRHVNAITDLMLDHPYIFFEHQTADKLRSVKDDSERRRILDPVYPQARILWFYIVALCRCLCNGEHLLTPYDAQLLGLVDEVLGGGPVESRREWRKSQPDYVQTESRN